jgi:hypothetical protein
MASSVSLAGKTSEIFEVVPNFGTASGIFTALQPPAKSNC